VEVGFYDHYETLIRAIDNAIEHVFSKPITLDNNITVTIQRQFWPSLYYAQNTGKVQLTLKENQSIDFSPQLHQLLGFSQSQIGRLINETNKPFTIKAKYPLDLDSGNHSIYVYCDILESIVVGDSLSPLLRIVDTTGKNGKLVHRFYDKTIYVPLQKKNFDTLELDIRSDLAEPIPFTYGKVVAVLHFRQAKNAYYLP